MDLGEQLEQTARREVFEETNLKIIDLDLFGVFSGEELHYVYPHGDEVYVVDVLYTSSHFEGNIQINAESMAYGFFEINQLPSKISPPTKPIVNELIKRYGNHE